MADLQDQVPGLMTTQKKLISVEKIIVNNFDKYRLNL